MGKGGGGSSQQKETASEKANAQVSAAKWDRYKSLYRPVERQFIKDVSKDTSSILRGRATADVAQAADGAIGESVALSRGTVSGLGTMASNLGGARITASAGANKEEQLVRDKGRLSALGIGQDMAVDARQGLGVAARASHTEALGKARAQQIENSARLQAIGQVAGIASGLHGDYKEYQKTHKNTGSFGGWIRAE